MNKYYFFSKRMADFSIFDKDAITFPSKWKNFYSNQCKYKYTLPIIHQKVYQKSLNQWYLFSLKHIQSQIETLYDNDHYVDIAIRKLGDERFQICSMMLDGETFFVRPEGGMRGVDRYYNINNANGKYYHQYTLAELILLLQNDNE